MAGMPMLNPMSSVYQPLSGGGAILPPGLSPAMSAVPLPGLDPLVGSQQVASAIGAQQAAATSMLLSQLKLMTGEIEQQFAAIRDHVKGIAADFSATIGPSTDHPDRPGRVPRAHTPRPTDPTRDRRYPKGERAEPEEGGGRHRRREGPRHLRDEPEPEPEEPSPHTPLS